MNKNSYYYLKVKFEIEKTLKDMEQFGIKLNGYDINFWKQTYNLSQEEIDQIMKDIKEEQNQLQFQYDPAGFNYYPQNDGEILKPKESNGNVCVHKMIAYTGLFEQYNFCEKCGQKEK